MAFEATQVKPNTHTGTKKEKMNSMENGISAMQWQARSHFLRCGGTKYTFREQDICFYYNFKANFSGHN